MSGAPEEEEEVTQPRRSADVRLRFRPVHLRLDVLGLPTAIVVSVYPSWETAISLEIQGDSRPRFFSIDSWHPRGMKAFCLVFHWHRARDERTFGCVCEINGQPHLVMDESQMESLIVRAVQDVLAFVNIVFKEHAREMRDYAAWYLRQASEDASAYSYSDVITRTACRMIVHCNLIAPGVRWKVVEFGDEERTAGSPSSATTDMTSLISEWHLSNADDRSC